ncbi:MAG: Ig-like domain-containing protein, partial [Natronospirillum sp.]
NAPTLTTVSIASSQTASETFADASHASDGNTVTIDITSSDVLSALPTVGIKSGGFDVQGSVTVAHDNPGAPDFQNFNVTYAVDGTGTTAGTDKDGDGTITFTIDFVDDAGISGTQITATTDVTSVEVDASEPTLTTVSLASSQTASETFVNASHGTTGNTITLSFTADDDLSANPTVGLSIGGTAVTATVNTGSAPNYTATYTLLGTENNGAITFTIDFTDDAGNAGTQVTATTDASSVEADFIAPTLSSVTLASSQTASEDFADANHATTGNLITLSFTADDDLSANPTVNMSIGGTGVTPTVNAGSAPNYTATYTLLGTENEGAITFTIDFVDDAGNSGTQVTATTNASSIEADFNAPTLTTVTLSTNNSTDNQHGTTGDVVTLSFTSTDVLSANPTVGMSIGGTGVTATVNDLGSNNYSATYTLLGTENEGAVTFTIDFVDDAGISGTQVTTTTDASSVEADFNAPTLSTVTLITDNGTDNQRAKDGNTVLLDLASSDVLSALPTVAIKSGGTDVQGPITVAHDNPGAPDFQNFNVTYAVDGVGSTPGTDKDADGAVTFTVDFVDDAGISGTQVTATTNASTVTVDASAPTVTGVSSSTADGSFIAGNVIAVTVTFSESVTVTGTPQLTLETGTTDRTVNYTSGSPGTTLTFNYTVQAGDVSADLDYETNNSLALNSGTITDGAGNAATLTLPSPAAPNSLGANKALVIDTSNPTISSTSPLDNATDVGITGDITITFNEDIAFGTGNITLVDITGAGTNTIVIDAAIPGSQASISGAVLTINPTANLELNNNYSVQIAATAIDDTAGNSFAGITDNTTLNFTTINTSVAFSSTTSSAAESTSSANLAVSLNSASGATVTVNYAVVGTATGGGTDYTLADGTLTFNPGDVTKNITIASIIDDALDENDETVIVTLSNPTNAGLGTNTQHTYTINDNDATPTVSFNT